MFHDQEETVRLNWAAILSFSGSIAVSFAIWVGLFRVVHYLVR